MSRGYVRGRLLYIAGTAGPISLKAGTQLGTGARWMARTSQNDTLRVRSHVLDVFLDIMDAWTVYI